MKVNLNIILKPPHYLHLGQYQIAERRLGHESQRKSISVDERSL